MPLFEYTVKDDTGKTLTGTQEAESVTQIVNHFRMKNYTVVKVSEAKKGGGTRLTVKRKRRRKIKLDDLVVFTRQLATMIEAGVPLVQALDILAEQMDNPSFQDVIKKIYAKVEGGGNFSDSLESHKKVFSTLYVSMVRAGEMSGQLYEILDRLALYLEKSASLQKKVKSALMYPIVVTMVSMGITLFMLAFVIPKFAEIFESLNAKLPTPTAMLISFSDLVKNNLLGVSIAVFILGVIFTRFIKTKSGKMWFHTYLLKMPIFGPIFMKVAMSKFTRTFSTLLKSGVPILVSFEIVSKTVGNALIENVLQQVRDAVQEGAGIGDTLTKKRVFPPMVVRMIAIGEETGEMEQMLGKIADFYDEQVDVAVSGLTSLIEPLIIVFLGGVIGTIVVCMFLPIFTITSAIS